MRYLGKVKMVSFDLTKVEYEPSKEDPVAEARFAAVVESLDRSSRPVQVPVQRVAVDPFSYRSSVFFGPLMPDEPAMVGGADDGQRAALIAAERMRREQEERNRQIDAAIEKVQLQGLIGGRRPIARVSGKTLQVGDVIDDVFTVVEIDGRQAIIEANSRRFLLRMNEEPTELDD
jgi:hypothetical protein